MNCNTATRPTTGSASAATGRLRPLFLRGSVPRDFATPFFKGPGALQRRPGFISPHYGNLGCVRRLVQHKEARDTGAFSREEGSHGRHHDVGPRRLARRKQIQDHIDAAAPQSVRASPLPPGPPLRITFPLSPASVLPATCHLQAAPRSTLLSSHRFLARLPAPKHPRPGSGCGFSAAGRRGCIPGYRLQGKWLIRCPERCRLPPAGLALVALRIRTLS